MTNAQLVKELQQLDPEATVHVVIKRKYGEVVSTAEVKQVAKGPAGKPVGQNPSLPRSYRPLAGDPLTAHQRWSNQSRRLNQIIQLN